MQEAVLLPRRMSAGDVDGSCGETISGPRSRDTGRRYADVCAEQLARPSGHLASNLFVHRPRRRQLALRNAQHRGLGINRVGARTPAHDVRGAGYVHEARDEATSG